jgi:NAD(P)-dependent dehydrogenase (short-subunit alcohol dehydrogenase family)
MGRLSGKNALVTGGSRGIGRAICERLAADGANVAVHYGTNEAAAEHTVEAIKAHGGTAFSVRAELGVPGEVDALFDAVSSGFAGGPLHILVNNVGVGGQTGSIESATYEQFDRIFAVNVRAPFFVIQRALALLGEGGRVINISSADTRVALPEELAYSMSKGAVNVLSRTLAEALGPRGITVNAVAPGVTDTGKLASLQARPELEAGTEAVTALGRIGQPSDIADVVAFLASDDARWVTGQIIEASGGLFLGPGGLRRMLNSHSRTSRA